jgi:hypothetical protein
MAASSEVNPFWGFMTPGSDRRWPMMDNGELQPRPGIVKEIAPRRRWLCFGGVARADG